MGFSASKNRQMLIQILFHMLVHRDILKSTGRLFKFLRWFYTFHGPENVPVDAFALWNMIRNVLDFCHEAVTQPKGEAIAVGGGSPLSAQIIFSAIDEQKGGRLCSTSRGRKGLTGCCSRAPWRAPSPSAAAAAKLLQSCPTLCDPIDGSPPGSPIPGILQARTLEWVATSLSNACKWKVKVKLLSRVWLLVTPWTAAYQGLPSMGFSRQEYWSRNL